MNECSHTAISRNASGGYTCLMCRAEIPADAPRRLVDANRVPIVGGDEPEHESHGLCWCGGRTHCTGGDRCDGVCELTLPPVEIRDWISEPKTSAEAGTETEAEQIAEYQAALRASRDLATLLDRRRDRAIEQNRAVDAKVSELRAERRSRERRGDR